MNRKIDTQLFVQIITDEERGGPYAIKMELIDSEGLPVQYFMGSSGNRYGVLIEDEFIAERTATETLKILGLGELIEQIFPPIQMPQAVKVPSPEE